MSKSENKSGPGNTGKASSKKKEALGKGIRALLRDMDTESPSVTGTAAITSGISEIPLSAIEVNPFQPRADFNEEMLQDLTDSIKVHGVIQPITVRRLASGKYQLISGERRLRASKSAGKKSIPTYIRVADDQEMLEIALIENIQREDLNAMEIAINYQRLLDECDLKHDELATRVGKNRSTVTNYLRLLRLPPQVQQALKTRVISMGHARALLGLDDPIAQIDLYSRISKQDLSVRQVEKMAREYKPGKKKAVKTKVQENTEFRKLEQQMSSGVSARVKIKQSTNTKGEIVIQYSSLEDLYRISEGLEF
ncbi:MAG: ParB family chromosome partitioning protein [Limisphaerales bacterium]|jgi:ParB family chromosome partitioning protein